MAGWLLTRHSEAKEEITPDSSKSTQDKVKETFTDTSDRVQRGAQSDENKSTGQEIYDKAQRMKDDHNGGASGTMLVDPVSPWIETQFQANP